jgi:hypothetical protein
MDSNPSTAAPPAGSAPSKRDAIVDALMRLAAAGISTEGPLGGLKLQGAVIVFSNTMQTWLDDDDPALARTMARLDRELRRGERVLARAEDVRRFLEPFRALRQEFFSRRRRRERRRERFEDFDDEDPAAAI